MNTKAILIMSLSLSVIATISAQTKKATSVTRAYNEQVKGTMNFTDSTDFIDARRGFIATLDGSFIPQLKMDGDKSATDEQKVSYHLADWDFLNKEFSPTANPLLWRQGQLNKIHGLFEVVAGHIYQIRGYDIANMTFIRSDNGWIVIDALCSMDAAAAGYELVKKHLGNFPIKAMIITHPHGDHFSGVQAILDAAPNKNDSIPIITPKGFFESAVSENILGGIAMNRRAMYMYGVTLPIGETGLIGNGLGQTLSAGSKNLNKPTMEIGEEGGSLSVDGVDMEFMFVPGGEAPVELMVYFPQLKAMCTAEEVTHTMHNLITPRGAQVRNGQLWSKHIDKMIVKYGASVEVSFATHHWPTWGNKRIVEYWEQQRDMYRYLHDQTLHLANQGYTPKEIAELVKLPKSISSNFANYEYYGTISHNVKAQYQLYFGWFDGNPANLNPLPPVEEGKKYVEAMGGAASVLKKSQKAFDEGDYRWAATLLNHLVFAEPNNMDARTLLADTYTQLGYQSGSSAWRNFYLTGAKELLEGGAKREKAHDANRSMQLTKNITSEMLFDLLAIQIDGNKAGSKDIVINVTLTDKGENISVILKNGALSNRPGILDKAPTLTVEGTKDAVYSMFLNPKSMEKMLADGSVKIAGDIMNLKEFFSVMEPSDPYFNIVEP